MMKNRNKMRIINRRREKISPKKFNQLINQSRISKIINCKIKNQTMINMKRKRTTKKRKRIIKNKTIRLKIKINKNNLRNK
jgi:hypothetical protein